MSEEKQVPTSHSPQFVHDCEQCRFIGRSDVGPGGGAQDVYLCQSDPSDARSTEIVRRLSDEPSDFRAAPLLLMVDILEQLRA